MLLTEATRTEVPGFVTGLSSAPNGCIPRLAYHYGADTLRRSVDSKEDLIRLLRTLIDGGLSSTDVIREHIAPERREWFDRRITGPDAESASGSTKGTRVPNDIADLVFGSPLARMASAAQMVDGPVMVFDAAGTKKAVAYRFPIAGGKFKEGWALATGFRLGPVSASDPMLERSFDMPNNQPATDTWAAFQTWANSQFTGTKDWFEHEVTPK
jgi:hypothetical protein